MWCACLVCIWGGLAHAQWPALEGRWALIQVFPLLAEIPLAGEVEQTSHVALFTEISQDDATLVMNDTYCFTHITTATPIAGTEIPQAFMESLTAQPRYGSLASSDGVLRLEMETYTEVRGAVLSDPDADPLPTDPEDPRIIDQDGDGSPGMSVHVSVLGLLEGQIHVVQRVRYRMSGYVVDENTMIGTLEWSDERTVVGATNPVFLTRSASRPHPDPARHRFVMIRVDDSWACETLRDRLAELLEIGS